MTSWRRFPFVLANPAAQADARTGIALLKCQSARAAGCER